MPWFGITGLSLSYADQNGVENWEFSSLAISHACHKLIIGIPNPPIVVVGKILFD